MADDTNLENGLAIAELTEWLNSSLCSCLIPPKSADDEASSEKNPEVTDSLSSPSSETVTIFEKVWTKAKIFQWLLHSFKPDLISCPQTISSSDEDDFANLSLAFKIAQEEFGVQNLLIIDDFAKDQPMDTLILLTYLAQLKYALRNVETACTNTSSRINLNLNSNSENDCLFVRSLSQSPKCHQCHETVSILDRFLLSTAAAAVVVSDSNTNAVRHRRCFRCEWCQKLLRIGLYRPTKNGVGYECLEHEKEDLVDRLTPAPSSAESKSKSIKSVEQKEKIYPNLAKKDETALYPRLTSPDKVHDLSTDSGVAVSSPDLTTTKSPSVKSVNQLSPPPVPSRSRSSDRDAPVPAPRKNVQHARGGSDIVGAAAISNSIENVAATSPEATSPNGKQSTRPERPVIPPKPKPTPNVALRRVYPEELNPFGDPVESGNVRHSTPQISEAEKSIKENRSIDQRRSMAVTSSANRSSSAKPMASERKQPKDYDETLNPFGSDSESDGEAAKDEDNDDGSSLSSTNPFNESEDESDGKRGPFGDDSKTGIKKAPPPPRPPPPAKPTPPAAAASSTKQAIKKRPAPPPPPPPSASGGPPPRPVSPKKHRKKRPAPPRPLPLKRQIRTESALSPEQVSLAFEENEKNLLKVESDGGVFETNLRQNANEKGFAKITDDAVREWVDFVHRKFELVRKETELVYVCRERQLDELHAEIEFQLRCIIEKPESEKTSDDMDREASLLQRMLDVIEEKSKLIDCQDEMNAQTGTLPRNSIQLDDLSLSGTASKSSTLDESSRGGGKEEKQVKKKKKIKLRLKKLKQKIANSMSNYPVSVVPM